MNIEMLLKEFKNILTLEKRAESFYGHYASMVDDEKIKRMLISIRNEEKRHINLAKELIALVS